ncbi:MAG TPA: hemerythrin domain-containing protein [Acidimicrobiia bacterium]|jgi:hemerythrin-like domain-containing protein
MATTNKTTRTAASKARATTKRATKATRKTARKAVKRTAKTTRPAAKRAVKKTRKAAKTTSAAAKRTAKATRKTAKKTVRKATRKAVAKKTPATRKATGAPRNRRNGRGAARRVDAIAFLKQEHRAVEEMFRRFESAGQGAARRREQLRDAITEALSQHAGIEELVFYPAVRDEVRGTDSTVLESLEEHHVVKLLLRECESMDPTDERLTAKMTVLKENVQHHVREEEHDLFPKVRSRIDRARLLELGDELREAKRTAPTRPHPYAPDEPPANALVGGAVAVVDRARNTGKRAVRRVRRELPL